MMKRNIRFYLLLFLLPLFSLFADDDKASVLLSVEPTPGRYSCDVTVRLSGPEGIRYRFLESEEDLYCDYSVPFQLTALPGSERTYSLVMAYDGGEYTCDYVIDKKPPRSPFPDISPGIYGSELEISFNSPESATLYAALDRIPSAPMTTDTLRIEQDRLSDRTVTVYTFCVDAAGNRSPLRSFAYTIRKSYKPDSVLRVYSPVAGSFINKQLFVCDTDDFEWIRYSVDGKDPVEYGIDYTGPVILNRTGPVRLTIAAKQSGGEVILRKEVAYSVAGGQSLQNIPDQGLFSDDMTIPALGNHFLFTLDDTDPKNSSPIFEFPLRLVTLPGSMKVYTLRLRQVNNTSGGENEPYRYVYVLDSRIPVQPSIKPSMQSPVSGDVNVTIESGPWDDVFYSLDGRTPDKRSVRYNGSFVASLPDTVGFGSIIIKAAAYGMNGRRSEESSYLLTFDREAPEPPRVTMHGPLEYGSFRFSLDADYGTTTVYEISTDGDEPEVPTKLSPVFTGDFSIQTPYGMDSSYRVRFASIDEAGNISRSSDVYTFRVDRLPPSAPELRMNETSLEAASPESVFYRLFQENASEQSTENFLFKPYSGPVVFDIPAGVIYRAEAYSKDDAGNVSSTVVGYFSKETETILPPGVYLPGNCDLFNSPRVIVKVTPVATDDIIRYTIATDGSEPAVPTITSARAESSVVFEGIPDGETSFRVKFAAFSGDDKLVSSPVEISFTIDLKKPQLPYLTGFEDGGIYNNGITITADSDKDSVVFYGISSEKEEIPDPFGPDGQIMPGHIRLEPREGKEDVYYVRIGSQDRAGNRILNETIYSLILDKQSPILPLPVGIPLNGISTGNVSVTFPSFQGTIYYNVTDDGSIPPEPDRSSQIYREKIVLHGVPGRETQYTLRIGCMDMAGNPGKESAIYSCIIDQKIPEIPGEPVIDVIREKEMVILYWPDITDNSIIFRLPDVNDTWYAYTSPISFDITGIRNSITVEYYSRDEAGNTSAQKEIRRSIPLSSDAPLFTGVADGGVYNKDVTIVRTAGRDLCRYEIGVNTDTPPPVTAFSPALPETLKIATVSGETVYYTIRVKLFPEAGGEINSREQIASFEIDRDPPDPPIIDGIRDGVYYQDDRTISFSSDEGTIFYRVARDDAADSDEEYQRYQRPVSLQLDERQFSSFHVSAYVIDDSGNRSAEKTWNTFIDKEIIYVSENGNDAYDGTRTHPFKTIGKAFEHSVQTDRGTIYIAGGYYPINDTLLLSGPIIISGGYDSGDWSRNEDEETVFLPGPYFQRNLPLFKAEGSKITIKNIRMYDTSGFTSALIAVNGGECTLTESFLERTGRGNGIIVDHQAGILYINNSQLKLARSEGMPALRASGGSVYFSDSLIESTGSDANLTLLSITGGSRFLSNRSTFRPGSGKKIVAFQMDNASAVLNECTVSSGSGTVSASAFDLKDAMMECAASTILGEAASRITAVIVSSNSEINLYNSLLKIQALQGALGIRATNSIVSISNCVIEGGDTEEFLYPFRLVNSFGYFYTNHMTSGLTSDFCLVKATGGNLKWFSNSGIFKGGRTRSVCFESQEGAFLSVVNSILVQTGSAMEGSFFQATDSTGLECLCNDIYGWGIVSATNAGILADIELFDASDRNPRGGMLHGNIAENPYLTFVVSKTNEFLLKGTSSCVNNGFDVRPLGGPDRDWEGQIRPNPYSGIKPVFDIGADEFYE